jgi:hypothetical protein
VQKEAAEHELSGGQMTANTKKRLTAAQQEIALREQAIAMYQAEIEELSASYAYDLDRFRALKARSAANR